jgi:hypothetical protein
MSIVNEEWRDVCGFEGYYQVSSLGRVRSLDRYIQYTGVGKGSGCHFYKGQILKPRIARHGYYQVVLRKPSVKKSFTIHLIVAPAFLGDRPKGFHVNHIDGNKLNNCVGNLEYCSPKENTQHAFRLGLCDTRIGDNHPRAKLKDADIPVIRDRILQGHTHKAIAKDYGVSISAIGLVVIGKNWAHNQENPIPKGFYVPRVGSVTSKAKLTEADIPIIRQRLAAGEPQYAIAGDYGVNRSSISAINTRRSWTHV